MYVNNVNTLLIFAGEPEAFDVFSTIYGTFIVDCPGTITSIIPPHMDISFELLLSSSIPIATAAATVGFSGEVHMVKGMIFTNCLCSVMHFLS
jgi:hypothetical protein